jgi:phenylacetate-CoA ligase
MVLETECIPEIVAQETFEPVTPGEVGELLITNLGRRGAPLFRYRTGDLVEAATTPSPTRLQLLRLAGGVLGRADQMITIRGNNVFPSGIEAILRDFDGIAEFRIEVTTVREMQNLRLLIEPAPEIHDVAGFFKQLELMLADRLGFHVEVRGVSPGTLPRFEMKAQRFHRVEE